MTGSNILHYLHTILDLQGSGRKAGPPDSSPEFHHYGVLHYCIIYIKHLIGQHHVSSMC